MSIWIRALCRQPVIFTNEEIAAGIGERLDLLTALYCPDDEESSKEVLARLRIELLEQDVWALRYRSDDRFIRVERWQGVSAAEEAHELRARVTSLGGADVATVYALLDAVAEIVAFELKASDANAMGWPVAVAAAAWLAAHGEGLIHAEGEGWMAPTRKEIRFVLTEGSRYS